MTADTNPASFPTIQELLDDGTISQEYSRHYGAGRAVDYRGYGWYSLDDFGIYRPEIFPTYSRIWLEGQYDDPEAET